MSFMAIRLIAAFLVLAGIAVFAIWGMNLAGGAFANGFSFTGMETIRSCTSRRSS